MTDSSLTTHHASRRTGTTAAASSGHAPCARASGHPPRGSQGAHAPWSTAAPHGPRGCRRPHAAAVSRLGSRGRQRAPPRSAAASPPAGTRPCDRQRTRASWPTAGSHGRGAVSRPTPPRSSTLGTPAADSSLAPARRQPPVHLRGGSPPHLRGAPPPRTPEAGSHRRTPPWRSAVAGNPRGGPPPHPRGGQRPRTAVTVSRLMPRWPSVGTHPDRSRPPPPWRLAHLTVRRPHRPHPRTGQLASVPVVRRPKSSRPTTIR
jgi:hypothetical protein